MIETLERKSDPKGNIIQTARALANDANFTFFGKKERRGRHDFKSAASITMMSVSPESPERLAEILQEILALSNSTRASRSESVSGSDPIELFDAHCVKEQSQRRDEEENNGQRS
jgi:hypothetical protein